MMSNRPPHHRRQPKTITSMPPRPPAFSGGTIIEPPVTGVTPAHSRPENAEVLKAIGELSKTLAVLAKNQKVLSDRLSYIEGLINNNHYNVVTGFEYMRWLVWAVGYWVTIDDNDVWGRNVPKMPHWH
jgi:hypothetical protein